MYSDCNSSAKSRDFFHIGIMLKTKGSVNTQEFDLIVMCFDDIEFKILTHSLALFASLALSWPSLLIYA